MTLPSADETGWQVARLFPVAGIGSGEEQEMRATSALLAVMSTVWEFGRVLTTRYGTPAGLIETAILLIKHRGVVDPTQRCWPADAVSPQ